MPARHYRVQQTREVRVTANSLEDAVTIAAAAFNHGQNIDNGARNAPMGVYGNTDTKIHAIDISAYEER